MGVVSDIWSAVPKELKVIFGIAIFVNVGVTILNVMIFAWNGVIAGINIGNGCLTDAALCIPQSNGIIIFGINFADYWIINALIFFPVIALFAIRWYSMVFGMGANR